MQKQSSTTKKIAAGVGLAALAAAAAATYYFKGPEGKKHQKEAMAMAKKAKMEMLAKMKQMKNFSKEAYHKATAEVLAKYKQAKNINPKDLQALGHELKSHWDNIAKTVEKSAQKMSAATAKKVVPKKKGKK